MVLTKQKKKRRKNPVCIVWWRDAAYADAKLLPAGEPQVQATVGFIIKATKQYLNIATNVNYNRDTGELYPVDGFVIPDGAIVQFRKLGWAYEK